MSVYLIADIDVHDAGKYRDYVRQARPLVEAHGGQYRVQGGDPTTVSGGWSPKRIVMIEFPSLESLRQCFGSDAYKQVAPLREQSTTSRAIVLRGCSEKEL